MSARPLLLEIQAFGGRRLFAESRRFPQRTAGNRRLGSASRKPQTGLRQLRCVTFGQKNPRAHKNKIGTSPPPPKPPPNTRNFMDMGFPAERTHFSRCPYIWRGHFRPQNCGHEFYGHEDFSDLVRRTQERCGGLEGENPAAFPQARPIFQQPFSLPESAQTLAGIAFRAVGKSGRNFPAASKFAGKPFQQGTQRTLPY